MKKNCLFIFAGFLIISCTSEISNYKNVKGAYEISDDTISKVCYQKNVSERFLDFMKNPSESARALNDSDNTTDVESELFVELWESLSDDEKIELLENSNDIEVDFDTGIEVEKDSDIARAVLTGDDSELDNVADYIGLMAKIKDIAGSQKVNISRIFDDDTDFCEIEASVLLESCLQNEDWNSLKRILAELHCSEEYKNIKEIWLNLQKRWNQSNADDESRGASTGLMGYSSALKKDLGKELKDGDIILTNYGVKAYVICGNWSHGGIFSKTEYLNNGRSDSAFSVYTAQPDIEGTILEPREKNMKPDRYGKACLEPIYAYTKMHKIAVIRPKHYSESRAAAAVNTAKTIYYDKNAKYNLPIWEAAFRKPNTVMGWIFTPTYSTISTFVKGLDTSHDLTSKNTYCTKVVYTAWKKNGVDLDSNTFAGNLVSPDDIYNSSINRYVGITIKFGFWKKTFKKRIYKATTNVIFEKARY